jgi:hypothetical protein
MHRASVALLLVAWSLAAGPRLRHAEWSLNGAAVCSATGGRGDPRIVSDGSGGAIVTWDDYRSGANGDIYAQHMLASGVVDHCDCWPWTATFCQAGRTRCPAFLRWSLKSPHSRANHPEARPSAVLCLTDLS